MLQISPDYLLQDLLTSNEISNIKALEELWRNTSPSQQELATAMLETMWKASAENE